MSLYVIPESELPHGQRRAAQLAKTCKVSQRTAERWIREGCNWFEADIAAVRLGGVHPSDWWPEWDMDPWRWLRIEALDESLALRAS